MRADQGALDDDVRQWSIGNDAVDVTIDARGEQAVWTLTDRVSGRRYGPSELPRAQAAGLPLRWSGTAPTAQRRDHDGRSELHFSVVDIDQAVELGCTFSLAAELPFVMLEAAITNRGREPVLLDGCTILQLAVAGEQHTLFHVEQFSWPYRRDFFSQQQVPLVAGRTPYELRMGSFPSHYPAPSSCAWFALRDGAPDREGELPNSGDGLVAGIEFNGKSRLRAWAQAGSTGITSSVDALAHELAPGAVFAVPACFVGCFSGDWDEAGYQTQRFAERYVHPPLPDDNYPWAQYNSWRYEQNINEAQQLEAIERAAELGLEVAVMDLGWAAQIGEWRHDPHKFPRGLRPLADRAHELGLRFGVHMALAQAAPASRVAREHPDWLIHDGDDYYAAGPLCLGHRPCREWLIDAILHAVDEYGLDYITQDGEDMVKWCPSNEHTHHPGDSNYANSAQGLDEVIATVRRERPRLVLENCEDGGCMMTYKMARLYHTSITVDNIATYATRQGIYGASFPFSPRYSVRYMQDDPTPYTLRSALFGGPLIMMHRVTEFDPEQVATTKANIRLYKELRGLIRGAKIIHLLPPRSNTPGGGWGWDAIQAVTPDRARSAVLVYRALGESDGKTVRPRGLRGDRVYRVSLADRGDSFELSGAQLERDGIALELPELASELIRIEQI